MVRRAQDERTEQDRRPLQYTVLLTKTDKIPDSEIAARALQVTQDVQAHLDSVVRVIQTSVVDKIGADSVWKIITAA
jgi:GTP-binding protein EngB required for normal cell division